MSELSQLLLTFLLNACWQIALVAMAAALCGWLLRGTAARHRHLLWVIALTGCQTCSPKLTNQATGVETSVNSTCPEGDG